MVSKEYARAYKEVIEILRQDSKLDELYPYRYLSEEETIVRVKERNI